MRVRAEQTKLVGAAPEVVYGILADPAHHAHILPEAYFRDYKPTAADTVTFVCIAGPFKRHFTLRTEQTEKNRVFREIDVETGIVTEFLLEPHPDGTLVTIRVDYEAAKSVSGVMEALFAPRFLRQLYEEELTKLARYALVANVSERI